MMFPFHVPLVNIQKAMEITMFNRYIIYFYGPFSPFSSSQTARIPQEFVAAETKLEASTFRS
jgi:uncharacterized protein YwgA